MTLFGKPGEPAFLNEIAYVFDHRVRKYGGTPAGVLWKNTDGQQLRFEILAGILDEIELADPVSINDFGCGYGAMFDFFSTFPGLSRLNYTGYDISKEMIDTAERRIQDRRATFKQAALIDQSADFTFVSGTYNLKIIVEEKPWNAYVKASLSQLWERSHKGLAFNMLDSNHPNKGKDLYFAEAADFMDFCRGLTTNITLIDDYPLHEWTIFLRR
jgi:SAM-dependent methyltransferase